MRDASEFSLYQESWLLPTASLPVQALRKYEDLINDSEISFLPILKSNVSSLYQQLSSKMRLAFDEMYPSLKIGNFVFYYTRKDNPRVLEVYPGQSSKLIHLVVSLINASNLTSSERALAFNELIDSDLNKHIRCDAYEFVAILLRVDEKTLRRDVKNAK